MSDYACSRCKKELDSGQTYEYRGAYSCETCFDAVIENRDFERGEIIREESKKTERFRGLDLGDSVIGKANREVLKRDIEIASKESARIKAYEGR